MVLAVHFIPVQWFDHIKSGSDAKFFGTILKWVFQVTCNLK